MSRPLLLWAALLALCVVVTGWTLGGWLARHASTPTAPDLPHLSATGCGEHTLGAFEVTIRPTQTSVRPAGGEPVTLHWAAASDILADRYAESEFAPGDPERVLDAGCDEGVVLWLPRD